MTPTNRPSHREAAATKYEAWIKISNTVAEYSANAGHQDKAIFIFGWDAATEKYKASIEKLEAENKKLFQIAKNLRNIDEDWGDNAHDFDLYERKRP